MRFFSTTLVAAALGIALSLTGERASASDFPNRPIRLVVGFAAGGSTDVTGRAVASELQAILGQPVAVENKPGAGTMIAADTVKRAPPDGYTLMYASPSTIVAPLMQKNATFDMARDLVTVGVVTTQPMGILVTPELGIRSLTQLVEFARANPGRINFASTGNGTSEHLLIEAISDRLGIKFTHVPYKGSGQVLVDLIAGRVHMTVNSLFGPTLDSVRSGKLYLVGLTSAGREATYPDVQTLRDVGVQDFSFHSWGAVLAPAGTPSAVVEKINLAIQKIAADGKFQKAVAAQAMTVRNWSVEESKAFMDKQTTFFVDAVKKSNPSMD